MDSLESTLADLHARAEAAHTKGAQSRAEANRLQTELDALTQRLKDEYGITWEQASAKLDELTHEAEEAIGQARAALEAEGI